MIQRFKPVVMGIAILLSGCAGTSDQDRTADFSDGATLLKVAHLPSSTADGSPLYITVDGKEAGALPTGEAMLLQVPAGEHQVGGYARSIISSVTLPAIKVRTSSAKPSFVSYKVTQHDPLFRERSKDPLPESAPIPVKKPKPKLVGRSDPVPVPQIIKLSTIESEPDTVLSDGPAHQEDATPAEATQAPAAVNSEAGLNAPTAPSPSPESATPPQTGPNVTPQPERPPALITQPQAAADNGTQSVLPPAVTAKPSAVSSPPAQSVTPPAVITQPGATQNSGSPATSSASQEPQSPVSQEQPTTPAASAPVVP